MIRVKDLIAELQECDPEAIVLYAFNEYGQNGTHAFISKDEMVCLINDDVAMDGNHDIVCLDIQDYIEDDFHDEKFSKETNTWVPAIKLFAA